MVTAAAVTIYSSVRPSRFFVMNTVAKFYIYNVSRRNLRLNDNHTFTQNPKTPNRQHTLACTQHTDNSCHVSTVHNTEPHYVILGSKHVVLKTMYFYCYNYCVINVTKELVYVKTHLKYPLMMAK
jgi:hypothetical protein